MHFSCCQPPWLAFAVTSASEPKVSPLSATNLASTWADQAGNGEHSKRGRRLKFAPTGSEVDSKVLQAQDSAQAQLMQASRTESERVSTHFYKNMS